MSAQIENDEELLISAGLEPKIAKKVTKFYVNGKDLDVCDARLELLKAMRYAEPPRSDEEAKLRKEIVDGMLVAFPELKDQLKEAP